MEKELQLISLSKDGMKNTAPGVDIPIWAKMNGHRSEIKRKNDQKTIQKRRKDLSI